MSLEHSTIPQEKTAVNIRWNVILPSLVALAVFAVGGALRLQDDQHVTRYVSHAGITTLIIESRTAHFGGAFDCSSVQHSR